MSIPPFAPGEDDAGFTLVELLVVIVLIGITTSIVLSGVAQALRQTVHAEERITTLTNLQTAAANVTREIRAAHPSSAAGASLRAAQPDRVQFDVFRRLDPAGTALSRIRFTYTVQGTALMEERRVWADRTADTVTVSPTSISSRTVMSDLAIPAGDPVLRYRNADGTCLSGCAGTLATVLTSGQLSQVREVELYLRRDLGPGRGVIDVRTKVALRNAS